MKMLLFIVVAVDVMPPPTWRVNIILIKECHFLTLNFAL